MEEKNSRIENESSQKDENNDVDFGIDDTAEDAEKNWKQAMYEEEHDISVPLSDIYELIKKYTKK